MTSDHARTNGWLACSVNQAYTSAPTCDLTTLLHNPKFKILLYGLCASFHLSSVATRGCSNKYSVYVVTGLRLKSHQKTNKSSVPWGPMLAFMPTHYLNKTSWMPTSLFNLSNTVWLRWAPVPANGLGSMFSQWVLILILHCFCSPQTPGQLFHLNTQ